MNSQTAPGSGEMFDAIAHRYDLLNRLISFGTDRLWRRRLVKSVPAARNGRVLDLATGTADVAIALAHRYPEAEVVGLDPSRGMLAIGQQKVERHGITDRVGLVVGDAQELPFSDGEFDAVTMSFGIRNVSDRQKALREIARVTRVGGEVAILELGEPRKGLFAPLARFHVHRVVPFIGGLLSVSREYRYLQRSIAEFPEPDRFVIDMSQAGLPGASVRRMGFGSAHLFTAQIELDCRPGTRYDS